MKFVILYLIVMTNIVFAKNEVEVLPDVTHLMTNKVCLNRLQYYVNNTHDSYQLIPVIEKGNHKQCVGSTTVSCKESKWNGHLSCK